MKLFPPKSQFTSLLHFHIHRISMIFILLLIVSGIMTFYREQDHLTQVRLFNSEVHTLKDEIIKLKSVEASLTAELETLKNEDLRKTNTDLKEKIAQVETVFRLASKTIENLSDARYQGIAVTKLESDLAIAVNSLSQLEYDDASTQFSTINTKVDELIAAKTAQVTAQATPVQDPPLAGSYRRQSVTTTRGTFTISLVAESAGSVKMISDTANDDTCTNNCAVLPLASFVARNGGFAGINGSYFCPPDYPSCADKVNSSNTLVFNARLKKYMNSDQNVYSTNPMVVQNADRSMRFMATALEWGRDTDIIGGLSNYPILVSGGQARVSDSGGKGPRGFIGVKGNTLYIGVVHGADLGDAAGVLATLGLDTAMNLDGGGSSALYYNGKYVVGPGRNLPNAIILAR